MSSEPLSSPLSSGDFPICTSPTSSPSEEEFQKRKEAAILLQSQQQLLLQIQLENEKNKQQQQQKQKEPLVKAPLSPAGSSVAWKDASIRTASTSAISDEWSLATHSSAQHRNPSSAVEDQMDAESIALQQQSEQLRIHKEAHERKLKLQKQLEENSRPDLRCRPDLSRYPPDPKDPPVSPSRRRSRPPETPLPTAPATVTRSSSLSNPNSNYESLYQEQQAFVASLSPSTSRTTTDHVIPEDRLFQHSASMPVMPSLPSSPRLEPTDESRHLSLSQSTSSSQRHESRAEWQEKRRSLPPEFTLPPNQLSLPSPAHTSTSCPRNPCEQQEWNDQEAQRPTQVLPEESPSSRALAHQTSTPSVSSTPRTPSTPILSTRHSSNLERPASTTRSTSQSRRSQRDLDREQQRELDPDKVIIERLPPPANSVSSHTTRCPNGDILVDEHHSFVGAYRVTNLDHHPTLVEPPSEPHIITTAGPDTDDQSTITQSISTAQRSRFNDEPESSLPMMSPVGCDEPELPPLPATVVNDALTARVARVRITVQKAHEQLNESGKKKNDHAPHQKSTLTYVLGGLCFALVVGAIFLVLAFKSEAFAFVGLYREDDDPPRSLAPTSPRPTNPPTVVVPSAAPSRLPTMAPTPIVLDLPDFTLQALSTSPDSPQALAYAWLLTDMAYYGEETTALPPDHDRPVAQWYQRFALATLYFATNEENGWEIRKDWMRHDLEACDWLGDNIVLPGERRLCDPDTGLYESLDLASYNLEGHIPPELSLLTTLKLLDLQQNRLDDCEQCIPTELGRLSQLEIFRMFSSFAQGSIPSEIGRWTNLQDLDLGRNRFESQIPSEVGLLTKLQRLDVSNNALVGNLPVELSLPMSLELHYLDVDHNFLEGPIPSEFSDAFSARSARDSSILAPNGLFSARFTVNYFTGVVPEGMCDLQQRFKFDCDPDNLCGCDWCVCATTR